MREQLWALGVVVSAKAFMTSTTERRAPDWTGMPARLGLLLAALRNVQVCNGRWAQTPAPQDLDRRVDLSVVPR